ncbi:MAG: glycosyltransferase [Anaerolineae bacterium]
MIAILVVVIASALIIIALTMSLNLLTFPKLSADERPQTTPLVSIMIPARNEAPVIGDTVRHILAQDYKHFELLILDDGSDDGTAAIAEEASAGDTRLKILKGDEAIPEGWIGKSWACHRLSEVAQGDILLFTDADVIWQPNALNSVLAQMQASASDMLTVWSTPITESYAERLTVPLIGMVILGYLPVVMVHHSPFSMFAAANGQLMAWNREAYAQVGGHGVVANNVLDDVTLAKAAKRAGYRIYMTDGGGQVATRMYEDWQSVRDGFAKNILAGYGGVIPLLMGAVFHWLVFMVPYGLLLLDEYRMAGLILIGTGILIRSISAWFTGQRVQDSVLMPITVILFTIISAQAIYWHYRGGPRWKGRQLSKDDNR